VNLKFRTLAAVDALIIRYESGLWGEISKISRISQCPLCDIFRKNLTFVHQDPDCRGCPANDENGSMCSTFYPESYNFLLQQRGQSYNGKTKFLNMEWWESTAYYALRRAYMYRLMREKIIKYEEYLFDEFPYDFRVDLIFIEDEYQKFLQIKKQIRTKIETETELAEDLQNLVARSVLRVKLSMGCSTTMDG